MRTYGRVTNEDGTRSWVVVQTDNAGNNDMLWVVTLAQALKLSLGESPFYAQYGIPGQRSVAQQIWPDFYVARTQAQFTPYFASLQVAKLPSPEPSYKINVTTKQGLKVTGPIPS